MRRSILLTAFVIVMSVVLAACTSSSTPTATPGGGALPTNSPTAESTGTPAGTVTPNVYDLSGSYIVTIENGVQIVKMVQAKAGYEPAAITIQQGVPVRWEIDSQETRTCASKLRCEALGVSVDLQPGQNVVEFTPQELGEVVFHCGMKDCKMGEKHKGSFTVVEASSN